MEKDNGEKFRQIDHETEIEEGDIILYYCDISRKDIKAEVLGLLEPVADNIIICKRLEEEMADLVDFKKVPVYLISSKKEAFIRSNTCECGAQYTSNPRYHLSYCPLHGR